MMGWSWIMIKNTLEEVGREGGREGGRKGGNEGKEGGRRGGREIEKKLLLGSEAGQG